MDCVCLTFHVGLFFPVIFRLKSARFIQIFHTLGVERSIFFLFVNILLPCFKLSMT